MNVPFFRTAERRLELHTRLAEWIGTPFHLGAAVRGLGVDCVHFVAEVLRECGQLDRYNFPAYSLDGGAHLKASAVLSWLVADGRFGRVEPGLHMAGDVLVFRIENAGVEHHVGIYSGDLPGRLVSAMGSDGVQVRSLNDATWGAKLTQVWRPLDLQK